MGCRAVGAEGVGVSLAMAGGALYRGEGPATPAGPLTGDRGQGTRDGRCGTRSIIPRTCLDVGDSGGVSAGSLLAPPLGVAGGGLPGRAASRAPLSSHRCSEERCSFQPLSLLKVNALEHDWATLRPLFVKKVATFFNGRKRSK